MTHAIFILEIQVQIEFAEFIANKIADENKDIAHFLESLFKLTVEGIIKLPIFKNIINVFYIDYCIMKSQT